MTSVSDCVVKEHRRVVQGAGRPPARCHGRLCRARRSARYRHTGQPAGRGACHRAQVAYFASNERERAAPLARPFEASSSRSRGGAVVTNELRSSCAASATRSTARLNARSLTLEGRVKPLNFRTNWRADARISSPVAGGLKLCRVLMLRHIENPPLLSLFDRADHGARRRSAGTLTAYGIRSATGMAECGAASAVTISPGRSAVGEA